MRKKFNYLCLLMFISINVINGASLDLVKTANTNSTNIGSVFTYTLQYRCASTTEDCNGVVITDPLPASLEYVGLSGSVHTTNESYDAATNTVTFTFQDPLTAGTVGQVTINVRFPANVTPNGTVANNTATMSASNAPSVSSSAVVTAIATDRVEIDKFYAGGVADEQTIYTIRIKNGGFNALRADNIILTDVLPPNVIFQSATNGGTYNASNNTITWNLGSLNKDQSITVRAIIVFPSSQYNVGDNVTNTATVLYTPVGATQKSKSASVSHPIQMGRASSSIGKTGQSRYERGSSGGSHSFTYGNRSNIPIAGFFIEDFFPDGLRPREIGKGDFFLSDPSANVQKTILYQTNLNNTWTVFFGPVAVNDKANNLNVSSLGLAANEYITALRWDFGPDPWPVGSGLNGDIDIRYENIPLDAPLGFATNCVEFGGDTITSPNYFQNNCQTFEITDLVVGFRPAVQKAQRQKNVGGFKNTDGVDYNTGDTLTFRLQVRNDPGSNINIPDLLVADLLPRGLKYIDNSWSYTPGGSNAPSPTFTKTDNYNGTNKTRLVWDFNGFSLPPGFGSTIFIFFDAVITPQANSGQNVIRNEYAILSSAEAIGCVRTNAEGGVKVDNEDIDNDGNTTESLCFGFARIDIITRVALSSEKFVKGQLDADFTKFPNFGNAVPGGVADYKLIVRNDGNVPIKEIKIVDILPFIGDAGVIDLSPRNSRWRPNLAGAVSAPPGVIVFYSTEGNPCRDAEGIEPNGPAGCQPPNWTTSVPADITTVQSLKFDFGTFVLEPADSILLEWPMRAPVNTLQNVGSLPDTIAWASFGYVGTRADNNNLLLAAEPLKVGIRMEQFVPAVLGDQVWLDVNLNGIKDNNENGLDGVKVELYRDNGDGIVEPNQDILETFTITGNDGFYLFPNLDAGNYFIVYYVPPNFDITSDNVGTNNAIDSDATLTTVNGFKAAITPLINLGSMAVDLTWDLGIFPNNKTSIGNYVWIDENGDGIQNESSNFGVNGLTVNLYQSSNLSIPVQTTTTVDDLNGNPGFYLFRDLAPGGYQIELVIPNGTTATTQGPTGTSDPNDSDIAATGRTEVFTFFADNYDDNWDLGILVSGTEICDNLVDDDGDGLTDCQDDDCEIAVPTAIIND